MNFIFQALRLYYISRDHCKYYHVVDSNYLFYFLNFILLYFLFSIFCSLWPVWRSLKQYRPLLFSDNIWLVCLPPNSQYFRQSFLLNFVRKRDKRKEQIFKDWTFAGKIFKSLGFFYSTLSTHTSTNMVSCFYSYNVPVVQLKSVPERFIGEEGSPDKYVGQEKKEIGFHWELEWLIMCKAHEWQVPYLVWLLKQNETETWVWCWESYVHTCCTA